MDVNPTFAPKQVDIINLIDLYRSNKFQGAETDDNGRRRIFINIGDTPSLTTSKRIDLDTKDIRVISEDGNYLAAWLLQKELKIWMKQQGFGADLNWMVLNLPRYGHIVLKKVRGGLGRVNLQSFWVDPTVSRLEDSPQIEEYLYSPEQLQRVSRELKWSEAGTQRILDEEPDEDNKYKVLSQYDPLGEGNNLHIVSKIGETNGVVLFEGKLSETPYREHKWEDVPGRWLGRGVFETLFENQIIKNKNANQFDSAKEWTSKQIFQTRDSGINRNLLGQVDNGEILRVDSEITDVPNNERNLSGFQYADQVVDDNTRDRSFSQDIIRGERPPAGTPLGTSRLQAASAGEYFDFQRESFGMFIKKLIVEDIIPEFRKKKSAKHIFNLIGDIEGLEKIDRLIVNARTNEKILNRLSSNGVLPTRDELRLMRGLESDRVKSREGRQIEIPDGFYDDLEFKVDVLITSEQLDISAQQSTRFTLIQLIASNPGVLKDPRTRKMLLRLAEISGISAEELITPEEEGLEQTALNLGAEKGGSLARPPAPVPGATAQVTQTL